MKKLAILLVLMMLLSMISMINVSADAIEFFGSNNAIKNGTASIFVEKGSAAKQLIVAGYNGNTMTSATPVAIPAGSGKEIVKVPTLSKDVTAARFFLWDNLTDMTPLMSATTKDLTAKDYYTINVVDNDMAQVGWAYGSSSSNNKRVGTNRAIPVLKGSVVSYNVPDGVYMCIDYFPFIGAVEADGSKRKYWIGKGATHNSVGTYGIPGDGYVAFTFCDAANSKNALPLATFKTTYDPGVTIQIPYPEDTKITKSDIAQGGYVYGTANTASDRIRVNQLIPIEPGSTVKYDIGELQIHIAVLANGEESQGYAEKIGWVTGSGIFNVTKKGWLAIIMMIDDEIPVTPDDYDKYGASISISTVPNMTIITPDDIERGAWGHGTALNGNNLDNRLRVNRLIPVYLNGGVLSYNLPQGLYMYVRQVKEPSTSNPPSNTVQYKGWVTGTGTLPATTQGGYFAISFCNNPQVDTHIDLSEYNAQVAVYTGSYEPPKPPVDSTSTYPADRRIIKKINNDWTFVYLPENYDASKEYPLVIANHGNGWVMNGTEEKANWTDITSYRHPDHVDTSRNHVANEDSDVWYSNEIIETLLAKGYIVAGAQNGFIINPSTGKEEHSLYGNSVCRETCAAFYDYMIDEYSIDTDNCFMLGASNGCMTSLNAATYLYKYKGVKIKGLILQYPLCSLKTHYLGYSNHQAGIRLAYNVPSGVTLDKDNFYQYIPEEYDPVRMAETLDYFPATLFCYSPNDTTTPASINTNPLKDALSANGIEYAELTASGGHGHPSHFKAAEFADWLDAQLKK